MVVRLLKREVLTVFVDGEVIFQGGKFARFDAQDAYAQLDARAAELEDKIGIRDTAAWPLVE